VIAVSQSEVRQICASKVAVLVPVCMSLTVKIVEAMSLVSLPAAEFKRAASVIRIRKAGAMVVDDLIVS
jgi:hypothetical protein